MFFNRAGEGRGRIERHQVEGHGQGRFQRRSEFEELPARNASARQVEIARGHRIFQPAAEEEQPGGPEVAGDPNGTRKVAFQTGHPVKLSRSAGFDNLRMRKFASGFASG